MKLTLRLADHETETGQSRTLETGRLTIGRGPENDWVLADPDRTLSKNHCRIDASASGFMLTDLSTNGVFLSGASSPIGRGQSCALEDGDSFALGPYRMQAEIAGLAQPGGLGLAQPEGNRGLLGPAFGNGGSPPPIAPTIPEGWAADMPSGGFGPDRRAAPEGWEAPPDPATYAASGPFEQPAMPGARTLPEHPFAASPSLFATQSEHIPAASTVMRLPESQVVLPTDWNDIDPMDSMSVRPAVPTSAPPVRPAPPSAPMPPAAPGPQAAAWPPALPEEPPPPPSLPADWVKPEPAQAALPPEWQPPSVPAAPRPEILPPGAPAQTAPPVAAMQALLPPPAPAPAIVRPASRPARPAPPRVTPPPARPAAPPPAPPGAAADDGPVTPDQLLQALLEGAGLPPEMLQDADALATMREIGQMVRAAVDGVRDIMSTRALVKSEFRVDQTVLKRSDNNAVKFAPDVQRCLAAMVGQPPPGFLPGPEAMRQALDDIKAHELALVAALNSVFADMDQQLDPEAIMRRARQDTGISTMLPYAREARCWAIYVETHRVLRESGAANTGGSLLAPLAHAYGRQLRRGA